MSTTHTDGLRVVQLTAENYKRLTAVDITPNPDHPTVVIGGRNAQGKSSVLDALWSAIRGTDAAKSTGTTRPIHDGADTARVRVDLGELIVTRTWKGDKSTLTVTSADGAKYTSPQKMLDDLVGAVSFDPLAFARASARDQRDALLGLVDLSIDLAAHDEGRKRAFEDRTEVGRQAKALGTPQVDESLPAEEESATAIIDRLREAQELHRKVSESAEALSIAEQKVADLRAELANWEATVESRRAAVEALPDELPDLDHLEQRLATVEETNAAIRANNQARELLDRKTDLQVEYEHLTATLDEFDSKKAAALSAASFPVDGLGFDDHGVTYQGLPFSQASAAEQMRVSIATAMAANPRLRVVRIADGSLLDDESMQMVEELATAGGFQVWIERVGDPGEIGVLIEDGQVQS